MSHGTRNRGGAIRGYAILRESDMKNYVNHKFCLVEDDEIVSSSCISKTDVFCMVLLIIAIVTMIACGLMIFTQ